jgi:hypothetical protein
VFGSLAQSAVGWVSGENYDYSPSPVLQITDDIQAAISKAGKLIRDGKDPFTDISIDDVIAMLEYAAKGIGMATGIPTPYLVQVEKALRSGEPINLLYSEWALKDASPDAETKAESEIEKLGKTIEQTPEEIAEGKATKLYTTSALNTKLSSFYSNVLPSTIKSDNAIIMSWAAKETAWQTAGAIPNTELKNLLNFDSDGENVIDYYDQWKRREKITNLADLKDFDSLNPNAYKGNISRQQYNLLIQYSKLTGKAKTDFLEAHPELSSNLREDYLTAHPQENALLALWEQADVFTEKAYNALRQLQDKLDIPDAALSSKIPTKDVSKSYFDWSDAVNQYGTSSAEAKLIRLNDTKLEEWGEENLNWTLPTDNKLSLEIQVKYRKDYDAYKALETTDAKNKYLETHAEFSYQKNLAYALDLKDKKGNFMPQSIAIQYAEYRKAKSGTAYRRSHPILNAWMVNNGHWQALS